MESETRPNKAHPESGQAETLDPLKVAPTSLQISSLRQIADYYLKAGI